MRGSVFFLCAVLFASQVALAGHIDVYIPSVEVSASETSRELLITASLENGDVYNFGGFVLKVDITGDSGCIFNGPAAQPSSDYLLDLFENWDGGSLADGGRTLQEATDTREDSYDVDASSGDVNRNVAKLEVAFSGISVDDTFTLSFDAGCTDDTGMWDYSGEFYGSTEMPTITWHGGTITVIPEPSTFVLGGIAALALFAFNCRWRRR